MDRRTALIAAAKIVSRMEHLSINERETLTIHYAEAFTKWLEEGKV
jgi:hypothetical protein